MIRLIRALTEKIISFTVIIFLELT